MLLKLQVTCQTNMNVKVTDVTVVSPVKIETRYNTS